MNRSEKVPIVPLTILERKLFTDFRISCSNGMSFPCHKAFLYANSPVLERMIESNMKEAKEDEMVLNYEEVVVEGFVKFFYTGQVDSEVLKEHSVSFLDLGGQYEMPGLKSQAEQSMRACLSVENVLRFLGVGVMYNGEEIKEAAKAYFAANISSLDTSEVREYLKENEYLMFELIF